MKKEKASTKRKRNKKEESARIFNKLLENNDLSKDTRDMRLHERSFKLWGMSKKVKTHQEKKFNQIKEDEEKKK